MKRAEIRLSSDGEQLVVPVFLDECLIEIVAGPASLVLGALPNLDVAPENVTGLTEEYRSMWGVRKEPHFEL